ncbi:MAG: N-acetylmuramoyl-L-alanine amidase [Pseudomonadota bacterium]
MYFNIFFKVRFYFLLGIGLLSSSFLFSDTLVLYEKSNKVCSLYASYNDDSAKTYHSFDELTACLFFEKQTEFGSYIINSNKIKLKENDLFIEVNSSKFKLSNEVILKGKQFFVPDSFIFDLLKLLLNKEYKIKKKLQSKAKVLKIIVIDPGHGGDDYGARSTVVDGLYEKEITLKIAKLLLPQLSDRIGAQIVMTRYEDYFIPLKDRIDTANEIKADLYISIHINASKKKDINGFETYFLSPKAIDSYSKEVALLENKHINYFNDIKSKIVPTLKSVLLDLAMKDFIADSSRLAEIIQRNIISMTTFEDRGIRQAPFYVLLGAQMPSVLLEAGFITNEKDAIYLSNASTYNKIVDGIIKSLDVFDIIISQKRGKR